MSDYLHLNAAAQSYGCAFIRLTRIIHQIRIATYYCLHFALYAVFGALLACFDRL
ncbi:MAG TPA: hypothetical protein VGS41_04830 [Chthonomonadales bacterium]|nr:hypothetical protein [Chthonomonadales bacterium]